MRPRDITGLENPSAGRTRSACVQPRYREKND
jgi:hypothetical protein